MKSLKHYSALVGLSGLFACSVLNVAQAHTPYLAPNAFEPINGGLITLDASFAEHFFIPEVVFDGSEFEVRLPNGNVEEPDVVQALKSRVVVEHELIEDGTYRFSTGRRPGRVFKIYELNGERFVPETRGDEVPVEATLTDHYQSNTMAETYVTRGGPTEAALSARGDGLEFVARSHPNDLFAGETLNLQALIYEQPLSGLSIEVFRAERGAKDDQPLAVLSSKSDGSFAFSPEQGGVYLLRARHRAPAPAGAQAPEISHTYTLVVEAVE